MEVKIFDTLTKEVSVLKALDGKRFRFYCCGPTVYGPAHIGNFRTFLLQDVFRRVLEIAGLNPHHVRNITDVDDKTIRQSQLERVSLSDFTEKWTRQFWADCGELNMLPPHDEPKATQHIQQQIDIIQQLIDKGHAYVAEDGSVYFKVKSFKDYGKLSHIDLCALETQEETSGHGANLADEYARESVSDFALWKAHKPEDGQNAWESPWGKGRPGWHIECSAMSRQYLGDTFDLHAGGIDLIFPHHENEIAQSEAATGKQFCRHWLHSAHLKVEGEKMSKSLGNFYTLNDIKRKGISPMVLRYALIAAHYRQTLNLTHDSLHAAESALNKLEKYTDRLLQKAGLHEKDFKKMQAGPFEDSWGIFESVAENLFNDLNTAGALGCLFTAFAKLDIEQLSSADALNNLKALARVLYLFGLNLFVAKREHIEIPKDVHNLAQDRWEAKKQRNFELADALRDQLHIMGWAVVDKKDGFDVVPLTDNNS